MSIGLLALKLALLLATQLLTLKSGDRSRARDLRQEIVNNDPKCPKTFIRLARLAAEDGHKDVAGKCVDQAGELVLDNARQTIRRD